MVGKDRIEGLFTPKEVQYKISGSESFTRWLAPFAADGRGHVRGRPRKGPWTAAEGAADMSKALSKASPGHVQGPVCPRLALDMSKALSVQG